MKRFNGMSIPELVKLKVSEFEFELLMSVCLRHMYIIWSPHDLPMYVHENVCMYACVCTDMRYV